MESLRKFVKIRSLDCSTNLKFFFQRTERNGLFQKRKKTLKLFIISKQVAVNNKIVLSGCAQDLEFKHISGKNIKQRCVRELFEIKLELLKTKELACSFNIM